MYPTKGNSLSYPMKRYRYPPTGNVKLTVDRNKCEIPVDVHTISMFASFTITTSRTTSTRWKNYGYYLFILFVVVLVVSILPKK